MRTGVTLLSVLAAITAGDNRPQPFHCWTQPDDAIRCQWPKTHSNARVVYSKTFDRDSEPLVDCRPDDQLTTANEIGCTTQYVNSFIQYTLRLLDENDKKIWQINKFIGQNYLKITDPLIDFDAERYGNGTVHLTWNYNSSQKYLNALHGEKIVLKLLYRPFMQSGSYFERILGYQTDLERQIYLNDLPNSQVLELCVRIKKNDSLVKTWSPCSNKVILRPVNLPTIATPTPTVNVICSDRHDCEPQKQNKFKNKVVFVSTSCVLFAIVFIFAWVVKHNWHRIKQSILPPIPYPTLHFTDPEADSVEEELSDGLLLERHDILETTIADTTLEITNRTEITLLTHNDTINTVTDNNRSAGSDSFRDSNVPSNTSQRSLDSGFGAPEPSTGDQETLPLFNCPRQPTPQTPSSSLL